MICDENVKILPDSWFPGLHELHEAVKICRYKVQPPSDDHEHLVWTLIKTLEIPEFLPTLGNPPSSAYPGNLRPQPILGNPHHILKQLSEIKQIIAKSPLMLTNTKEEEGST
ncbi:hypothetical protein BT96DRAFT_947206, partial [Gymnopus androsaceus JB14]